MKKWITIVLSVCVGTAALATEEVSYLAGELPPPTKIEKVLSAGNPADVLLLLSAPNKLLGLAGILFNTFKDFFAHILVLIELFANRDFFNRLFYFRVEKRAIHS
jgi:hypothetical protein